MPAIQPAKLKQESARLVQLYDQPDIFSRELHRVLDRYADRTQRPTQSGEAASILPSFNVPPPLMRQLIRDLKPLAQSKKEESLILCDTLWSQGNFEMRSLAAFLLGQLELNPPTLITRRLMAWSDETLDERMVQVLLDYGLARMREEAHEQVIALAAEWLDSPSLAKKQLGARVLITSAKDPTSGNIPAIFRLTTPYIRKVDRDLRPDILRLWRYLAEVTPNETAYHLRQNLQAPENPDIEWYIRHLIPYFPKDIQISLRKAIRDSESIK